MGLRPTHRANSLRVEDRFEELEETCSATKAAQRTGHEEPCAKRFIPNPSPIMTTTPLVSVLTMLSVMGYWRLLPDLPDTVKAFVDVQQVTQGFTPPPPTLPRSVPYTSKKCSVTLQGASRSSLNLACAAVKRAWLFEAKRAVLTGEEVRDERLTKLYKRGREWYAQHVTQPEVCSPHCSLTSGFPISMHPPMSYS